MLLTTFNVILLVLGFGFVIFFHELGHFLAAKWCGVKVDQFAVGFGQAICSWRKGMGFRWGSSGKRYEALQAQAAADPGSVPDFNQMGETDYRLNWIPLGGYVKMLGQDDLHPNATAEDPRAYNRQSIGKRMIIVSAGVIMNVILAAIGFMVLFLIGFHVAPPIVGDILPGSPAQHTVNEAGQLAPLQVGDRILMFDGQWQHDFTKIGLNTALAKEGHPVLLYVERRDGTKQRLFITPERATPGPHGFLMLGIEQPRELRGISAKEAATVDLDPKMIVPDALAIRPGDVITAVDGQPVKPDQFWKLDEALQASGGQPVTLSVQDKQGQERQVKILPHFQRPFGDQSLTFAGMVPRSSVMNISDQSSAVGKLMPGDVIVKVSDKDSQITNPSAAELIEKLNHAGQNGQNVAMTVLRDGKDVTVEGLKPNLKVGKDAQGNTRYGLGIGLGFDERHAVVAAPKPADAASSPAARADIPAGATLISVGGKKVQNWFDVHRVLASGEPQKPIAVVASYNGTERSYEITLNQDELTRLRDDRLTALLDLHERIMVRQTRNPVTAAVWGITETRDFILQFYVTIQRMVQGSISYQNMMGPVGIFTAGTKFAYKGLDWLIWFLAMISANLAVVNFLPIPIVDGGLFLFLIIEKIKGRPLSARTMSIAQIVGLAVILGVFLLVTYQDIARLSFMH
jgi:regulator of sigma E protease